MYLHIEVLKRKKKWLDRFWVWKIFHFFCLGGLFRRHFCYFSCLFGRVFIKSFLRLSSNPETNIPLACIYDLLYYWENKRTRRAMDLEIYLQYPWGTLLFPMMESWTSTCRQVFGPNHMPDLTSQWKRDCPWIGLCMYYSGATNSPMRYSGALTSGQNQSWDVP